ncbi:HD domain-containing protein [Chromobacterium alticapitis]|uniref:Phosphohydrolase n=1 Tax=Chromobacterium alticapitis TaxID=2073169 RepID=A0A2S5DLZ9_9NEIS|nr:HD domain-containing protein [Chromobacterium alticapitis]POZ64041.1 phosphohydrolase [Chromobacterium alticapitis]
MQNIIEFALEIDKLKQVTRKTRVLNSERYENSAEHSWQIALLAASLQSYAAEPVDINQVVMMLLVHDIGEIETGDTIVYAESGWEERKAHELACVTRIFGMLAPEQGARFLDLWKEFEAGETAEARFANAADRAMPVLLNLANHGQSWLENGIRHEQVVKRIAPPIREGCPALWEYLEGRLLDAKAKGWLG